MEKITPHLWYDNEAKEAAEFYIRTFGAGSRMVSSRTLQDTPSGTVESVSFELLGQSFMAISAGPLFKFNPSVSFLVACETTDDVETLWGKLSEGGTALMEIGEYPFSEKYGWLQDRYGLSWQLMFAGDRQINQRITPTLMFVGDVCGKAEEAISFYTSIFHDSGIGEVLRYGKDEEPDEEGNIKHEGFTLEGEEFAAMDSARMHDFAFNEAISLMVHCADQADLDYYWDRLSAVPDAEQCGWLKDKYGFSWQIVPTALDEMLSDKDAEKVARVTEAFLKMKKFDISALRKAYDGR